MQNGTMTLREEKDQNLLNHTESKTTTKSELDLRTEASMRLDSLLDDFVEDHPEYWTLPIPERVKINQELYLRAEDEVLS